MTTLFPVELQGVVVRRRGKTILGPVDLRLGGDGLTIVIGPNGAGKTSFLSALHGTTRISGGQIAWACSMEEARQAQALVFQHPIMLRRSVAENLMYPLRLRGVSRGEARAQAERSAETVGLADALGRRATRLSGGEKQKLALARAMICTPRLLLLDEPCASLDGRATREIEDILIAARNGGTRIVMSTHDMGQARRLADDVIFLHGGQVQERAPAKAFFKGPKSAAARSFLMGDIVE